MIFSRGRRVQSKKRTKIWGFGYLQPLVLSSDLSHREQRQGKERPTEERACGRWGGERDREKQGRVGQR